MNYLMYRNSNSNSSESSYDLRVTSFFSLSDPPPSYEFDNIDAGNWKSLQTNTHL